jgi:hypothetical protein
VNRRHGASGSLHVVIVASHRVAGCVAKPQSPGSVMPMVSGCAVKIQVPGPLHAQKGMLADSVAPSRHGVRMLRSTGARQPIDIGPRPVSRPVMRAVALLALCACGMSEAECLELRSRAFDVINRAQPCMDDTECVAAEWPGCEKPLSTDSRAAIEGLREKFAAGRCKEELVVCRAVPEAFCDRNLCALRYDAAP